MNRQPDNKELMDLIGENERIIFKICNSYCSNKDDRKDLAQEIVYQLLRSYRQFKTGYKFSTWMYRIALNTAISFYRKTKTTNKIIAFVETQVETEDKTESSAESEKNITMLQQFITELKALDRALMILYFESKNYKEIAEIVGISETNVATKISRIKEKIKQKFSNHKN